MASLPSFAQAFSSQSLANIAPLRLPPIDDAGDRHNDRRKRDHSDASDARTPDHHDPAPAPSATLPSPSKRRRVTISGAPHPLDTDVRAPPEPSSTPISPVVMGLAINPTAADRVKSMLSVKQKQKALIQQRRGSAAALLSPEPPISFARRRAEQLGSTKKKPADIVISPREPHTQPAIQSAPPQSSFARFPMALPRLPSVLAAPDTNVRRIAAPVPPTPTRLAIARSPPAASVPIASAHTDKAAFLAPFEVFYDALNDSKQLKSWLAEQLQRSNSIITQQQEAVEKQLAPIRHEMHALQRRVEELEDALRAATGTSRLSVDLGPAKRSGTKSPLRNGITNSPIPTESYTFPAPPPSSSSSSSSCANLEPSLSSRRRTAATASSSPNWDTAPDPEAEDPKTARPALQAPDRPALSRHPSMSGESTSRRNSVIDGGG
ncbi:hypothetical protein H2248_007550 [Termitomyces sp. 'cryptogamus']|nr:hypothetical protein H2248_007550 [Termitomyces sp. 'cryptogamus']